MNDIILGIDQGSSKTLALAADCSGHILGTGQSDGACHSVHGMDRAMQAIREACMQALEQAGLTWDSVNLMIAGMTGADWPHEYPMLHDALQKTTGIRSIRVLNDCMIAMRGGTNHTHGAVLCAGSGLNCGIRSVDGREFIYGYYIDETDMGTGALTRRIISSVILSQTGILQPTLLTESVLQYFSLAGVDDLADKHLNGRLQGDRQGFVPMLFGAADKGDQAAINIITSFGQSISRYVVAGFRRFDMLDIETDIVLSGGIFKAGNPVLRESVALAVQEHAPKAKVVDAVYEPVVGALLIGLDEVYGGSLDEEVYRNVHASSSTHGLIRFREKSKCGE